MAYPAVAKLHHQIYTVTMADISAPSSVFIPVAFRGKIVAAYVAIQNAITTADSALSVKIGPAGATGAAVTGLTGTAAFTASAAGTVFTLGTPSSTDNVVNAGDNIELITDGASSTTAIATWTVIVHRF